MLMVCMNFHGMGEGGTTCDYVVIVLVKFPWEVSGISSELLTRDGYGGLVGPAPEPLCLALFSTESWLDMNQAIATCTCKVYIPDEIFQRYLLAKMLL